MRNPVRFALERLSRGVVLKRKFPVERGGASLWVSPDVSLRYWRQDVESFDVGLLRLARELTTPGAVVWDVGASVGLFSVAAAYAAGSAGAVVAIEADPWVGDLLRRTARTLPSSHAPLEVIPAAVLDRSGKVEFEVSSRGRAANHLSGMAGSSQAGKGRRLVSVPGVRLDDLLETCPAPNVLKIDVEGAEHLVLRGATVVLANCTAVLCEVAPQNSEEVRGTLISTGYGLFDADDTSLPRVRVERCCWNTLAVRA